MKTLEEKHAYEKKYRHTEKFRAYMRKYQKEYHRRGRLEVLLAAGGIKCKKCGFDDWRALQIDHVNGDGLLERKQIKSNARHLKKIKENPKRYQVLCGNCNWIKKYENGETKHLHWIKKL